MWGSFDKSNFHSLFLLVIYLNIQSWERSSLCISIYLVLGTKQCVYIYISSPGNEVVCIYLYIQSWERSSVCISIYLFLGTKQCVYIYISSLGNEIVCIYLYIQSWERSSVYETRKISLDLLYQNKMSQIRRLTRTGSVSKSINISSAATRAWRVSPFLNCSFHSFRSRERTIVPPETMLSP